MSPKSVPLRSALSLLALCLLGACAHRQSPAYEESPTYASNRQMQYGVVRAIETVSSRESTTGSGALIGGVVGAVVGRQMGSAGSARTAGTLLGAIGGAVAGNEIEHHNTQPAGRWRVQVQMDDGQMRSFNLAQPGELKVGDRVVADGPTLRRY